MSKKINIEEKASKDDVCPLGHEPSEIFSLEEYFKEQDAKRSPNDVPEEEMRRRFGLMAESIKRSADARCALYEHFHALDRIKKEALHDQRKAEKKAIRDFKERRRK